RFVGKIAVDPDRHAGAGCGAEPQQRILPFDIHRAPPVLQDTRCAWVPGVRQRYGGGKFTPVRPCSGPLVSRSRTNGSEQNRGNAMPAWVRNLLLGAALLGLPASAAAQSYPSRPITIVIGY